MASCNPDSGVGLKFDVFLRVYYEEMDSGTQITYGKEDHLSIANLLFENTKDLKSSWYQNTKTQLIDVIFCDVPPHVTLQCMVSSTVAFKTLCDTLKQGYLQSEMRQFLTSRGMRETLKLEVQYFCWVSIELVVPTEQLQTMEDHFLIRSAYSEHSQQEKLWQHSSTTRQDRYANQGVFSSNSSSPQAQSKPASTLFGNPDCALQSSGTGATKQSVDSQKSRESPFHQEQHNPNPTTPTSGSKQHSGEPSGVEIMQQMLSNPNAMTPEMIKYFNEMWLDMQQKKLTIPSTNPQQQQWKKFDAPTLPDHQSTSAQHQTGRGENISEGGKTSAPCDKQPSDKGEPGDKESNLKNTTASRKNTEVKEKKVEASGKHHGAETGSVSKGEPVAFTLYIDESLKKGIDDVNIVFDRVKGYNKHPLKQLSTGSNIWHLPSPVYVPYHARMQCFYKYSVQTKGGWWWSKKSKLTEGINRQIRVKAGFRHYDVFVLPEDTFDQKLCNVRGLCEYLEMALSEKPQPPYMYIGKILGFCEDQEAKSVSLFGSIDAAGFEEILKWTERLLNPRHDYANELTGSANYQQALALFVLLGKVSGQCNSKTCLFPLGYTSAKILLGCLRKEPRFQSFPDSRFAQMCLKFIENIADKLVHVVTGKRSKCSVFEYVIHLYPQLSQEVIAKYVGEDYIDYDHSILESDKMTAFQLIAENFEESGKRLLSYIVSKMKDADHLLKLEADIKKHMKTEYQSTAISVCRERIVNMVDKAFGKIQLKADCICDLLNVHSTFKLKLCKDRKYRNALTSKLLECVSQEGSRIWSRDKTAFQKMLLEDIDASQSQRGKLLLNLCREDSVKLEIVFELLSTEQFGSDLDPDDMKAVAMEWFRLSCSSSESDHASSLAPKDNALNSMFLAYGALDEILSRGPVSCNQMCKDALSNECFKKMTFVNISTILIHLGKVGNKGIAENLFFGQHVIQYLEKLLQAKQCNPKDLLFLVLDDNATYTSGASLHANRLKGAVACCLLSAVAVPKPDEPPSIVYRALFQNQKLWKLVLCTGGEVGKVLTKNQTFIFIEKTVNELVSAVITKELPVAMFQNLIELMDEYGYNNSLAFLKYFSKSSKSKHLLSQNLQDARELGNTVNERLDVLNEALEVFLKPLAGIIPIIDLPEFEQHLYEKRLLLKGEKGTSFKKVSTDDFWKGYLHMIEKLKHILILGGSKVFINVCQQILETKLHANGPEDDSHNTDESGSSLDVTCLFREHKDAESELVVAEEQVYDSDSGESVDSENGISGLFQQTEETCSEQCSESTPPRGMRVVEVIDVLSADCVKVYTAKFDPFFAQNDNPQLELVSRVFGDFDINKELQIASEFIRLPVPESIHSALMNFQLLSKMVSRATGMKDILKVFGITIDAREGGFMSILESLMKCKEDKGATLFQISYAVEQVQKVSAELDDSTWRAVKELSRSVQLVAYLKEKVDQDFRTLIDAVEEHSEHSLKEEDVNNFIEVKRFVQPLLKAKLEQVEQFFSVLKQCMQLGIIEVAEKIRACGYHLHSFKALVKGVGNREELTHEIITNAMTNGKYTFQLQDIDICQLSLSYRKHSHKVTKAMEEISDLRSRALLLYGSGDQQPQRYSKQQSNTSGRLGDTSVEQSEDLQDTHPLKLFAHSVESAMTICALYSQLHEKGHFNYRQISRTCPVNNLEQLQNFQQLLHDDLNSWQKTLQASRAKYYYMNFLRSDHLAEMYDFFARGVNLSAVLPVLQFINPSVKEQCLAAHVEFPNNNSLKDKLNFIGEKLNNIFADTKWCLRNIHDVETLPGFGRSNKAKRELEYSVSPGELYVAALDPRCKDAVGVVMELYANTTRCYPEAYQILFCNAETTWEEVELLIARCIYATNKVLAQSLYCLVGVELLPNDIQARLIEELISHKQAQEKYTHIRLIGDTDGQTFFDEVYAAKEAPPNVNNMLLALICRVEDYHPVIEAFSDNSHRVHGMSDQALIMCISKLRPNMTVVTSDLPGLGKSEFVSTLASDEGKGVKTLPIQGPVSKQRLVKRLNDLRLREHHLLHIDMSEIQHPLLLNSAMFELLVLGTTSAGKQYFNLVTNFVCIEVANTLKDALLEELTITKLFNRKHLKWENYENMIITDESSSAVQVVCQYINAVEQGTIDQMDIEFGEENALQPLSQDLCRVILRKYFRVENVSFALLQTFLNVLADQLKRFTKSYYFKMSSLQDMVGKVSNVRSTLVTAMIKVFSDFAKRSVDACKSGQLRAISGSTYQDTTGVSFESANRFENMLQWTQENHLFFIFHGQDPHTVSPLYRELSHVPKEIQDLFKNQVGQGLPDFSTKTRKELQDILERVVQENPRSEKEEIEYKTMMDSYALTPDNVLKMVLIYLRIKAKVPVIIMGETGCGKTRLVTYLAKTCGIKLTYLGLHAGLTETDIVHTISNRNEDAKCSPKDQFWVFLDEINTCDHIGLLNEIICHHRCLGEPLMPNISFVAACNPYKLRGEQNVQTAGLEGKITTDELSKLVYRVHPLPESMTDYVWDYGTLCEDDERYYIDRMLCDIFSNADKYDLLVQLIFDSQQFIRKFEGNKWCVSLRDVNRSRQLLAWMQMFLLRKQKFPNLFLPRNSSEVEVRAILLTLAHCYHSRLPKSTDRKHYWKVMSRVFRKHEIQLHASDIAKIISEEQQDIVNNMELPKGTAKNSALLENVFVMLVCILNKMPIFVVGKPGCSKSLSMQLIRTNLRGQESWNEFFREFPQVYIVSYQGSESSTSEGIVKVFEKARRYQQLNEDNNVLAVVLLDEVGLAEVSKSNPLKVLHNLMEPQDDAVQKVAVVGISNWALDGAKMNRAIHLSRPDLEEDELLDTAIAIGAVKLSSETRIFFRLQKKLYEAMSKAYFQYQKRQSYKNFHGLRDFYSLVKFLSKTDATREDDMVQCIYEGLQRNFGGLSIEMADILNTFMEKLSVMPNKLQRLPTQQLIRDNLTDQDARHLMLITSGGTALSILEHLLSDLGRDYEIIFGSRFEEDMSDDYNYRILSQIILCMERGIVLILKDLESVYSSLYDMLNQNYTVVDDKKNCRVALGPNSNPVCNVHDRFRCIVLVDQDRIPHTDPPFLNRFEKQMLRYSDVLSEEQNNIIKKLAAWVESLSTVSGFPLNVSSTFLGYNTETLPSVVLRYTDEEDSFAACQQALLRIACPEAVLRMSKSLLAQTTQAEITIYQDQYFSSYAHKGLGHFLKKVIGRDQDKTNFEDFKGDHVGTRLMVITHSNKYVPIRDNIQKICSSTKIEKLDTFKSEKMLLDYIKQFFESDAELFVLQCNPNLDAPKMLLAKAAIDRKRKDYAGTNDGVKSTKHICLIIHCEQNKSSDWNFAFSPGWHALVVDPLEEPLYPLPGLLGKNVYQILSSDIYSAEFCIQKELLHSFIFIDFSGAQRDVNKLKNLVERICTSEQMMKLLGENILKTLEKQGYNRPLLHKYAPDAWQVQVACDSHRFYGSWSCSSVLLQYIRERVCNALAPLIYMLEDTNAFSSFFDSELPHYSKECWVSLFRDTAIVDASKVAAPTSPECYSLTGNPLESKCPFSTHFFRKLEKIKMLWKEEFKWQITEQSSTGEPKIALPKMVTELYDVFKPALDQFFSHPFSRQMFGIFLGDLCCFVSSNITGKWSRKSCIQAISWAVFQRYDIECAGDPVLVVAKFFLHLWCNQDHIENQLQFMDVLRNNFTIDLDAMLPSPPFEWDNTTGFLTTLMDENNEKEGISNQLGVEFGNAQREDSDNSFLMSKTDDTVARTTTGRTEITISENSDEGSIHESHIDTQLLKSEKANSAALKDVQIEPNAQVAEKPADFPATGKEETIAKQVTETNISSRKTELAQAQNAFDDIPDAVQVIDEATVRGDVCADENDISFVDSTDLVQEGNICDQTLDNVFNMDTTVSCEPGVSSPTAENNVFNIEDRQRENGEFSKNSGDGLESHSVNNDGEVETDEQVEADDLRPEEKFVENVCTYLLPRKDVLSSCDGLENWQRKIGILSALAFQVSAYPTSLHLLRVFKDCVDIIVKQSVTGEAFIPEMCDLVEGMKELREDPMESDDFALLVIEELKKTALPNPAKQEFLCSFFGRCLDADIENPVLDHLLQVIEKREVPDPYLSFCGPVFARIVRSEIGFEHSLFDDILQKPEILEDHPQLQCLDRSVEMGAYFNTPLVILLTDILQRECFEWISVDEVANITSNESGLLHNMKCAARIVISTKEPSLIVASAVAILRQFLKILANIISESMKREHTRLSDLLIHISPLFQPNPDDLNEEKRSRDMFTYLLKELFEVSSLDLVLQFCDKYHSFFPSVECDAKLILLPLGHNPIGYAPHKSQVLDALAQLMKGVEDDIVECLKNARDTFDWRLSILAGLLEVFFLPRYSRQLKEAERNAVQYMNTKFDEFQSLYKKLAMCLMGTEEFSSSLLAPSLQQPTEFIEKALVIIHLSSIIVSSINTRLGHNLFETCFNSPKGLKNIAMPFDNAGNAEVNRWPLDTYFFYNCPCGQRMMEKKPLSVGQVEIMCLVCGNVGVVKHETSRKSEITDSNSRNIATWVEEMLANDASKVDKTRTIYDNPVVPMVAKIFFSSSIYGGIATASFDIQCLQDAMETNPVDVTVCLEKRIHAMWEELQSLIGGTRHHAADFLHVFLHQLSIEIGGQGGKGTYLSDNVEDVEKHFIQTVSSIYQKRHSLIQEYKQQDKRDGCVASVKAMLFESSVETADDSDDDEDGEDGGSVIQLFRLVSEPTLQNMICEYACFSEKDDFPFLGLFFQHKNRLTLTKFIMPILKWHRIILLKQNRRLTREYARSRSIQQIINGFEEKERRLLQTVFDELKSACLELEQKGKGIIPADIIGSLPNMHMTENVLGSECLITGRASPFFKLLEWLVNVQNDFLDECMLITLEKGCIATSFLATMKNIAVVKVVPVQECSSKHVLEYEWSDDFIQFFQNDTRYGCGTAIQYNFRSIEACLVNKLVMGKTWLAIGGAGDIAMFHYAREMFHASSNILQELDRLIPQEKSLPKEIFNSIQREKEQNPQHIVELLAQLEILLCLLKHTGGSKDECLLDYAKTWLSTSAQKFPEHILPDPPEVLTLSHLVCLYELLERIQSQKAVESLPVDFRVSLPQDEPRLLERVKLSMESDLANLEGLEICLSRFTYRFLSADTESTPKPNVPLVLFINDPPLWRDGWFVDGKLSLSGSADITSLVPEEVTVGHIYEFLNLVKQSIKDKQEKRRRSRVSRRTIPAGPARKRRQNQYMTNF